MIESTSSTDISNESTLDEDDDTTDVLNNEGTNPLWNDGNDRMYSEESEGETVSDVVQPSLDVRGNMMNETGSGEASPET